MRKILALAVVMSLALAAPAMAAYQKSIGRLFADKPDVKVYVNEVKNESGDNVATADAFHQVLISSLMNRRSMHFVIVKDPTKSDIEVSALITKFQYMDRGPLKPSPGVQTTLLDAVATATENYVEMTVDFTVTDPKSGKTLWQGDVYDYIKQVMTPSESAPLIYDRVARRFLWKCFGKPRRGSILM